MKTQISEQDSSLRYNSIYIIYVIDAVFIIVFILVSLINWHFEIMFLPISIMLLTLTLITKKHSTRYCEVFISDEYLFLEQNSKKDIIPFSNIKTVNYHSFFTSLAGEGTIVITFYEKTIFGKTIYFVPTKLDKMKRFKINQKILPLIFEKVENSQGKEKFETELAKHK